MPHAPTKWGRFSSHLAPFYDVTHPSGFRRDAQGAACFGGAPLSTLLRQAGVSTPAYLYDLDGLAAAARALEAAFGGAPHLTAYAVKANSAGSVVRALAAEGTGADVVSGAELELAMAAGITPARVVMSGVAKTDAEIDLAVAREIMAIQVESVEELVRVASRARALGRTARVALRVNPGVAADTHAHVATGHDDAKFGIPRSDVARAWTVADASPELEAVGVSAHVGSMLRDPEPYLAAARVVVSIARERHARTPLRYVDFGGGFGIDYGGAPAQEPGAFVRAALGLLANEGLGELTLVIEPGRALVGPFGVLVANVLQTKVSDARRWVMIDAGMNDLLRPALYAAKHRIEPLEHAPGEDEWRIVGPVCESADDFGVHPLGPTPPALVAIRDVGAYGFVMASEYNGRPLPAEVFVRGGRVVHVSPSPGAEDWLRKRLGA